MRSLVHSVLTLYSVSLIPLLMYLFMLILLRSPYTHSVVPTFRYGTTKEQYAKIAYKNHKHSVNNPYAQFKEEYSMEEILSSKEIIDPLTVGQLAQREGL